MGLSRARGTWAAFCVPGPRRGPWKFLPAAQFGCLLLVRNFKNPKRVAGGQAGASDPSSGYGVPGTARVPVPPRLNEEQGPKR